MTDPLESAAAGVSGTDLLVPRGDTLLAGELSGDGRAVLLLHGLSATRRYVTMGSRALERAGHRVIAYDARGHGDSAPAADRTAYSYGELVADAAALLDATGTARAVLAGVSMGAHTALALALADPERVAGVVAITPGHDPETFADPARLAHWDALARGLREGGVDGFLAAYGTPPGLSERQRALVTTATRQRLARHRDLAAVADALSTVPRSAPFRSLAALGAIAVPVVVVASRDELDPEHPHALAGAYAAAIPGASLVTEAPGKTPLAWQGGQISRVIAELAARAG